VCRLVIKQYISNIYICIYIYLHLCYTSVLCYQSMTARSYVTVVSITIILLLVSNKYTSQIHVPVHLYTFNSNDEMNIREQVGSQLGYIHSFVGFRSRSMIRVFYCSSSSFCCCCSCRNRCRRRCCTTNS
jgi:hypothetical protein